jgi:PhnB protein
MTATFKPAHYTSVAPYLITAGAQSVIDFLKGTFDVEELRRFDKPDGAIMHAEVRIDDTVVMIADAAPGWPSTAQHIHVYVKDVDETYRRGLSAGGTSVQAPEKKNDPDKRGGVKDPSGNTWWIATQLEQ